MTNELFANDPLLHALDLFFTDPIAHPLVNLDLSDDHRTAVVADMARRGAFDPIFKDDDPIGKALSAALTQDCFARLSTAGNLPLPPEAQGYIFGALLATTQRLTAKEGVKERLARQARLGAKIERLAAELSLEKDLPWLLADRRDELVRCCNLFAGQLKPEFDAPVAKRGNKSNKACDDLILSLSTRFQCAGGKAIGDGTFNRFLVALWRELPGQISSRLANSAEAFLRREKRLRPQIRKQERQSRRVT